MKKQIRQWMIFCAILVAAIFAFQGPVYAVSTAERNALIALYNSTDGDNWFDNTGWLGTADTECGWFGVSCDGANQVTGIYLGENNLVGPLPPEIGNLTNLVNLYLYDNQLASLPAEIGNLSNLTHLHVRGNQLDAMPTEIGNLTNLTYLDFYINRLTVLPPEIGNLTNLTELYLEDNLLRDLPTEFTNLTNLSSLSICKNYLSITDTAVIDFLDSKYPGWDTCQFEGGTHVPAIDPDTWGAVNYVTSDYNALELWVKIIDYDGVELVGDTPSHIVTAKGPNGDIYDLSYQYNENETAAFYEGWFSDVTPQAGDYIFTVTDPEGNSATYTDILVINPLPPVEKSSITPSLTTPDAEYITAAYDNVRVNGTLYENFDSYTTMDDIDGAKWWTGNCPGAEIQDGRLLITQENMLGGGTCSAIGLTDPAAASSIQADITVIDASSGLGRGRIGGNFYNDGVGDMYAAINVTTDRVYYYVGRNDETQQPHAPWIEVANGNIAQIEPGETVTASISWDGTTLTFAANGETASFTPEGTVISPVGPYVVLNTRISLSVPDSSPTFSWAPVEGALQYRVRIYNYNRSETIWNGYTGDTTYQIPPGILDPDGTYYARIDARDAHSNFDVDNMSRQPSAIEDYEFFPTSEAVAPFIEPDQNATTWTDSIIGSFISLWVIVHDAQGVPGNIASVKVISPQGSEIPLYFDIGNSNNGATKGVYQSDYFPLPLESGDYTFIATDVDGNTHSFTDNVDAAPLSPPNPSTALPAQDTVLSDTSVNFDWSDVDGAAFYRLEIYDSELTRLFKFATLDSAFILAPGYLKPQSFYRYRIISYDKFFEQNSDNAAVMESYRPETPSFFTSGGRTGGIYEPVIDLGWGVWVDKANRPGTNTPLYFLTFYITVEDGDGVPENIRSVTVTLPDGSVKSLRCEDKISDTSRYYWSREPFESVNDIQEGTYTFNVQDFDGNSSQATDELVINELLIPTGLSPEKEATVFTTTPTIDWNDVPDAKTYRIRIYDGWDGQLYKSDLLASSLFTVPSGILENGKVYSYRVEAHREQWPDEDVDNRSRSYMYYGNRVHFTVGSTGDNLPPAAPVPATPTDEAIDPDGSVVLQITDYTDPENDAHLATQWMVRRADMPYNREGYDPSFSYNVDGQDLLEHSLGGLIPGMKYVWKAAYIDGYGETSDMSQEIAFKVGDSAAGSVSAPAGSEAADFEMVSFVHWPNDPSESAVIGDDIGTYDTTMYRIGTYDAMMGGYVEYGEGMEIEPGRAYWIFTRNGLNISVDGVPVTLTHDVEVPLDFNSSTLDGWNMIAPPNDQTYAWSEVEIVVYDGNGGIVYGPVAIAELNDSNPYIDKRLWMWENGVYNPNAQDLFPNHGYWTRAFRDNVSLRFVSPRFPDAEEGQTVEARPAERLARAVEKAGQWLGDRMPGPRAAIADVGDTPPAPIGGFTGEPTDGASGAGDGGCFIMTTSQR